LTKAWDYVFKFVFETTRLQDNMKKLIFTILNYSKFFLSLIKARLFLGTKPLIVSISVTGRCNLSCSYCYGSYSIRKEKDFTTNELLDLIEELYKRGTKIIYLSGGEPLLRNDIGLIIKTIRDKNMFCFLNTNGLLVPDKIESLKNLDSITISLDGNEEVNDINRGKGTFKKVIEAIIVAKKAGLKVITTTVINSKNLNSIDFIVSLAKELKFTAAFSLPYESDNGNSVTHLSDKDIKMVLTQLVDYEKKGAPIAHSNSILLHALNWPFSYSKKFIFNDFKNNCYMGRFMCLIDSDGLVYPCGQLIGKFPALNIREVGFKKAWDALLRGRPCNSCYELCFTKFNQLFDMKLSVLFLIFKKHLNQRL